MGKVAFAIAILLLSAGIIAASYNSSAEYALKFKTSRGNSHSAVEQYDIPSPDTPTPHYNTPTPTTTPVNQQQSGLWQIATSILESIGMLTARIVAFVTDHLSQYGIDPQKMINGFDGPGFIEREFAWDHDPLTVSINVASGNIDPSAIDLAKSAIKDWQDRIRAGAGISNVPYNSAPFGIRYVSSSADIAITLIERAESVLGTTTAYYRLGKIVRADVVIATKSARGLALDKADIQNVAAHEFGHALGLGHSTVYGDVMYGSYDFISTSRVIHPSTCDIDRILSIYLKDESGFRPPNTYSESGTFTCQGS